MVEKIKKFYKLVKEFGTLKIISLLYFKKFNKKKYDLKILRFIKQENLEIINYYSNKKNEHQNKMKKNDNIWLFWWQGEESMPLLVMKCYENLKNNSGNHEVILISNENFHNFVDIPDYILKMFYEGNYSTTHFSDILRMCLLSQKGGIWVDATVYITGDFTSEIDKGYSIYTRKTRDKTRFISNGMWSSYFIATAKDNILSTACFDILCNYWSKHNVLLEYLLIDYIIYLLYIEIPCLKDQLNSIPYNNEGIHELEDLLNQEFNLENYNEICSNTYVHKLNWKKKYFKKNKKDNLTYFGYIIEKS